MAELQGALPYMQQRPGSALLGDASESSFAFYMAAGAVTMSTVILNTTGSVESGLPACAAARQRPACGRL